MWVLDDDGAPTRRLLIPCMDPANPKSKIKNPKSCGRGFTLIELLVVVVIISTLMGLIVTTSGLIRQKMRIEATRTLLLGISSGLDRFYTEFGVYPPSNSSDLNDTDMQPDSLYRALCSSDRRDIETNLLGFSTFSGKTIEPFIDVPAEYLRREGTSTIIVDAWGSPMLYLNCRGYTDTQRALNPAWPDDGLCHNPQSYDLYSFGQDRQKDPDPLNPVDDIINWSPTAATGAGS